MLKEIIQDRGLPPVWPDKAVPWEERKEEIRKMVCDYEYGPYPEENEVSFRNLLTHHGYLSGKAVLKILLKEQEKTGDVFIDGSIGFHMRKGPHDMGREDWNRFMDFITQK